jgi:hypothetical protein
MHDTHTHIPETNPVPRGYIVASILSLLFMVPLFLVLALALLFFYISTSRSLCAVPNMAVFCSSLTSRFPGMSLTYFLNDLEMVPVAPITLVTHNSEDDSGMLLRNVGKRLPDHTPQLPREIFSIRKQARK